MGCGPEGPCLLLGGNSPSLVLVVFLVVPTVWLSRLLEFLELFPGFFPLAASIC